jgi:hypothetical protein
VSRRSRGSSRYSLLRRPLRRSYAFRGMTVNQEAPRDRAHPLKIRVSPVRFRPWPRISRGNWGSV